MVLDHMIQDHYLGAKFHWSTVSQPKILQEFRIVNIGWGNKRLSSVTGVIAIPSVIFFPGLDPVL